MKRKIHAAGAVTLAVVLGLGTAALAQEDEEKAGGRWECRGQTEERPYVCEIGAPRLLTRSEFERHVQRDSAVRATVARLGMPDGAEMQQVLVDAPWLGWELRTYYRRYDKMFVYGRAFILGNPEVSMLRHQGPIPAEWLERQKTDPSTSAVQRAEQSAARAEAFADRIEGLAQRAEEASDQLAADFPRRLSKN